MNNSLFARKDQRKMQLCVGIQINATSVFKNELVFPTPRHDKGLILFRGNRSRLTGFDGQGVVTSESCCGEKFRSSSRFTVSPDAKTKNALAEPGSGSVCQTMGIETEGDCFQYR